jgi:hypothetical protein
MHFLSGPKGPTSLGYKHRGPIYPIIQHILITDINYVVDKLIKWKEEEESPLTKEFPSGTLIGRVTQLKRVYKIKRQILALKKK